ncbi:hypothetical protein ACFZDP_36700 [Streptomyces mirabilis]|uniref:alpha/beta hydrolase n=1 Tax=Streptomyces mirabilis TaxID=68239 RepID=UPI0036E53A14
MPRSTLTSLADDLASRGYAVASVDHSYESVGTDFPGGRLLACAACEQVGTRPEKAAVVRGRAKDMSFVIDELTSRQGTWLSRVVDPRRIGIAGHSIGGAAAAATMAIDDRVRAGVDLDGDFYACPAGAGLGQRPFMMLGAESTHSPQSVGTDWPDAWSHLNGWKRWLTATGAEPFSFTDLPYLAGQLGLSDPQSRSRVSAGGTSFATTWQPSSTFTFAVSPSRSLTAPPPLIPRSHSGSRSPATPNDHLRRCCLALRDRRASAGRGHE